MRGLALGDAFGESWLLRPAETMDADLAARRLADGPWPWTDDTAMALSLLRVLAQHGHVDQDTLANLFAAAYAADPFRSYGGSMHEVLRAIGAGESWSVATRRKFGGMGSWGNGAAMRVAPLGAWFAGDPSLAATEAAQSAEVTHGHPEAVAGAIAVAVAASLSATDLPATELLPAVLAHTPPSEVASRLRRVSRLPATADPRHVAGMVGCGSEISAVDTVPYALWCAASYLDDLTEALWTTATPGGDLDTTCAIVGGVVAARTGLTEVPTAWLTACEPLPTWVDDVPLTQHAK